MKTGIKLRNTQHSMKRIQTNGKKNEEKFMKLLAIIWKCCNKIEKQDISLWFYAEKLFALSLFLTRSLSGKIEASTK